MSTEPFRREYLVVAVSDHEMLTAYIEHFKRLFAAWPPQDTPETIFAIQQLLNEKLVNHFTHEEENLFPVLLLADSADDLAALVTRLQEDHKSLLAEVRRLNDMLSDHELVSDRPEELRQAMLDFFESLQTHASREDDLFRSLPGMRAFAA